MGMLCDRFNYIDDFVEAYRKYDMTVSREALEIFYSYVALETYETIFLDDIDIVEFLNDDLDLNIEDIMQHFDIDMEYLGSEDDDMEDTAVVLELIHTWLNNDGYELRHMDNNKNFVAFRQE